MIKIFYGDDRVKARAMIDKLLGDDYEVIEAENLTRGDMDSVFLGTSLFGETRKILIKSLAENKECWAMLPKYTNTAHAVFLLENSIDKRSVTYKELAKEKNVEFKEFHLAEAIDKNLVFDIFEVAYKKDGAKAVKMCERIETTNDPFMFLGLIVTQAFKKMELRERRATEAVKILGKTDVLMKTTTIEPWTAIKMALYKIANI